MDRYFIKHGDSDLVFMTQPQPVAPANSVKVISGMNDGFKKPVGNTPFTEVSEGAEPEDLRLANIERTKQKYEMHKMIGWEAYQDFRANIVEEIAEGTLLEEQAIEIELNLGIGYDRIQQTGDWKTAYYLLDTLVVSEPYVEPYRLSTLQIIGIYIQNNYDS